MMALRHSSRCISPSVVAVSNFPATTRRDGIPCRLSREPCTDKKIAISQEFGDFFCVYQKSEKVRIFANQNVNGLFYASEK